MKTQKRKPVLATSRKRLTKLKPDKKKVVQKRVEEWMVPKNENEQILEVNLEDSALLEWERANLHKDPLAESSELYRDLETNIYCDSRSHPYVKTARGITKIISQLYCGSLLGEDQRKVRRKNGSSLNTGSTFHRHMYHFVMCGKESFGKNPKTSCVCKVKYGKITSKRPGRKIKSWIDQALQVLDEHSIVPYKSEMIVFGENIATEIDMIAWKLCSDGSRKLCNISLKTGYSLRTLKSPLKRQRKFSAPLSSIDNSDYEQHQLQQQIENILLSEYHGTVINPSENYILYVGLEEGKAILQPASKWRNDKELREELFAHLKANTQCNSSAKTMNTII